MPESPSRQHAISVFRQPARYRGLVGPVNPERWRRIEELFDTALGLSGDERAAFLERSCGDDAALRAEVESLLEADEHAGERIESAIGDEASRIAAGETPRIEGRRLGPYRLVGELGRGGMGGVYLAVRDDDQYHTEVAVKLLPWGLETPEAIARFREERQILATLQHPGIVRLLDGGSEEGVPYLVMERIEGVPITEYVRERGLSVRARVALFERVCGAVQYAHQRLVVHRDLKPSNILVTGEGAPKLLDFGIAKLLGSDSGGREVPRTRTGMALLTPEYASPEQIRGEPASTATDVYSLGVILYELLTGERAHRIEGPSIQQAMKAILEVDAPRPSAVSSVALRRAIAGDLDNIVLKALEKDPARRYASAEQLGEDLRRYLDGLPVRARAGGWAYRAGKFVRRNRVLVSAVAVVAFALVAATVISLAQARRADEQARRAQRRFNDVRRLANSLLFEVDGKIQSLSGATAARQLIVSRALEYLDRLAREAAAEDHSLIEELAAAYMKIGDIQGSSLMPNLGRPTDALRSYRKAKGLLDRLPGSVGGRRWLRAKALLGIAGLLRWESQRRDQIRPMLLESLRLVESLSAGEKIDEAVVLVGYAALFTFDVQAGRIASARGHAEKALSRARRWEKATGAAEARYWVGVAHELRGEGLAAAAVAGGALRELTLAVAAFERLVARHPANGKYQRELWRALSYQAIFLTSRARFGWVPGGDDNRRAERAVRRALRVAETLSSRDPKDVRARTELASSRSQLAQLIIQKDPVTGTRLVERARSLLSSLPRAQRRGGYVKNHLRAINCSMARPFALAGLRERASDAIRRTEELLGPNPRASSSGFAARLGTLECLFQLSLARAALGRTQPAVRELRRIASELRTLISTRSSAIRAYVGAIEVLRAIARLQPSRGCAAIAEAEKLWSRWPGEKSRYVRARALELASARRRCR